MKPMTAAQRLSRLMTQGSIITAFLLCVASVSAAACTSVASVKMMAWNCTSPTIAQAGS